jgi:pyruvate/2-oxoglutarate dehydrogenase complex dihydrolipoamide acyltransferase (E2) component
VFHRRKNSAPEGERSPGRSHCAPYAPHATIFERATRFERATIFERMTIFERRMLARGLGARLEPVQTANCVERPCAGPRAADYAAHAVYPAARWYTVRRMNARVKAQVRCGCPSVAPWDQHTGEAEVLCACPLGEQLVGEYAGECSDTRHFYMKHDLCVPGSQRKRARGGDSAEAAEAARAEAAETARAEAAPRQAAERAEATPAARKRACAAKFRALAPEPGSLVPCI